MPVSEPQWMLFLEGFNKEALFPFYLFPTITCNQTCISAGQVGGMVAMVTQRSLVVNDKTFDLQTPFKALKVTLQTGEIKYIKATSMNVREYVQTDVFIKYSLDTRGDREQRYESNGGRMDRTGGEVRGWQEGV